MDKTLAPIALQEPLIIERLRIGFPKSTFAIERAPSAFSIRELDNVSRRAPFIGLAWLGLGNPHGARNLFGDMNWRLWLVHRASSSLQARFKGDVRGLGMDAMVDVSCALMHGQTFDGVGKTHVTGANSAVPNGYADDNLVMAHVDFSFSFATNATELQLETADDFTQLGVTWSLHESAEGTPEQTDTINLGA